MAKTKNIYPNVSSTLTSHPESFTSFGKRLAISPKACTSHNKAGFKIEYFVPTVQVLIGIGKDHTGYLVMPEDAWEALNNGETIEITTAKTFRKQIK